MVDRLVPGTRVTVTGIYTIVERKKVTKDNVGQVALR